jgi:hypothetical protein
MPEVATVLPKTKASSFALEYDSHLGMLEEEEEEEEEEEDASASLLWPFGSPYFAKLAQRSDMNEAILSASTRLEEGGQSSGRPVTTVLPKTNAF